LGHSANGVLRRRPEYPNHVWCYDFLKDQTTDGRDVLTFAQRTAKMGFSEVQGSSRYRGLSGRCEYYYLTHAPAQVA
jgi:hypothetical protein